MQWVESSQIVLGWKTGCLMQSISSRVRAVREQVFDSTDAVDLLIAKANPLFPTFQTTHREMLVGAIYPMALPGEGNLQS